MNGPRILLLSSDLMVASRLAGLAAACGAVLEHRREADANDGPCVLVLVDLQGLPGDAAAVVGRLRSAWPAGACPRLVAFGPHVAREALAAARAAGADDVVSRGELLGGFAALFARWCG